MTTKKIIVTGPESTGKTVLCEFLSEYFEGLWIPEYARQYIEKLDGSYKKNDVVEIGKKQIEQWNRNYNDHEWVFFDTGLVITKVWMELVYNESPAWISKALSDYKPDLVLLCFPDLAWEPDPVRENGGSMRDHLFSMYEQNLDQLGYSYYIVKGESDQRNRNAVNAINNHFKR